ARRMLVRDIENLTAYFGRFDPQLLATDYGAEIWSLYQSGTLQAGTELTGRVEHNERLVNVGSVMRVVANVLKKETALQRYRQTMRR
ncbi:MAG: PA4780 family RIO1-like protein kinase, partial [Nitrosospira sp.]